MDAIFSKSNYNQLDIAFEQSVPSDVTGPWWALTAYCFLPFLNCFRESKGEISMCSQAWRMSFLIMNVTYGSFGRQLDETNQSIEMDPHWCYRNDEPTMTVTVIEV